VAATYEKTDALSVASYIASQLGDDGTRDPMRLQKLLYYSQGWFLAWTGQRLFPEDFQAWVGGPVQPLVWKTITKRELPAKVASDATARAVVDAVLDFYGHLSGIELSALTHSESPWVEARGDLPASMGSKRLVPVDSIRRHFALRTFVDEPRPRRPSLTAPAAISEDVLDAGARASTRWRKALDELAHR
jgi:uncharacterized phage-associated protein